MSSVVALPTFLFIVLAVALLPALLNALSARRRARTATGHRGARRHWVLRVVPAALGALILLAMAVTTWRQARSALPDGETAEGTTVRVPTVSEPGPSLPEGQSQADLDQARALLYFILLEVDADGWRAVHAEETELRWPEARGRCVEQSFEAAGYSFRFRLTDPRPVARRVSESAVLALQGHLELRHAGHQSTGHTSASGLWSDPIRVLGTIHQRAAADPLSLVRPPDRSLVPLCLFTPVAEDDPLKEAPLSELIRTHSMDLSVALSNYTPFARRPFRSGTSTPGALALVERHGVSALLLLLAAVLATQFFTRRTLAFPAVLAGVLLYAAALDRAVLAARTSRLGDPDLDPVARSAAAEQVLESFFYRATAASRLQTLVEDAGTPSYLRERAAELLLQADPEVEVRRPAGRAGTHFHPSPPDASRPLVLTYAASPAKKALLKEALSRRGSPGGQGTEVPQGGIFGVRLIRVTDVTLGDRALYHDERRVKSGRAFDRVTRFRLTFPPGWHAVPEVTAERPELTFSVRFEQHYRQGRGGGMNLVLAESVQSRVQ